MIYYAAWLVVIGCIAVFFEFGSLLTGSAEMARIFAFLVLVMILGSLIAMILLDGGKRPAGLKSRHNHYRRVRSEGRPSDW